MGEVRFQASDSEGQHEERHQGERILGAGRQRKEGAKRERVAEPVSRKADDDGERKKP